MAAAEERLSEATVVVTYLTVSGSFLSSDLHWVFFIWPEKKAYPPGKKSVFGSTWLTSTQSPTHSPDAPSPADERPTRPA